MRNALDNKIECILVDGSVTVCPCRDLNGYND